MGLAENAAAYLNTLRYTTVQTKSQHWRVEEGDMVLFSPTPGWFHDVSGDCLECPSDDFSDEDLIIFATQMGWNPEENNE